MSRAITVHLVPNYIKLPMTETSVTNFLMHENKRTRSENDMALT